MRRAAQSGGGSHSHEHSDRSTSKDRNDRYYNGSRNCRNRDISFQATLTSRMGNMTSASSLSSSFRNSCSDSTYQGDHDELDDEKIESKYHHAIQKLPRTKINKKRDKTDNTFLKS